MNVLAESVSPGLRVELPAMLPTGDMMYHQVEVLQVLTGSELRKVVKSLPDTDMVVVVGKDLSSKMRHVSLLPVGTSLTILEGN